MTIDLNIFLDYDHADSVAALVFDLTLEHLKCENISSEEGFEEYRQNFTKSLSSSIGGYKWMKFLDNNIDYFLTRVQFFVLTMLPNHPSRIAQSFRTWIKESTLETINDIIPFVHELPALFD